MQDWYKRNQWTITVVFFSIEHVVAIVISLVFLCRYRRYDPSDAHQGLEVRKWGQRSESELRFAKYSALLLTTLYLPVCSAALLRLLEQQFAVCRWRAMRSKCSAAT